MAAPEMFNLDGRVAVVTGGNGGIGRGIALGLAAAGAAVAVLARNADKNEAVLGELRALNAASIALRLDVTDRYAPVEAGKSRHKDCCRVALNERHRGLGGLQPVVDPVHQP